MTKNRGPTNPNFLPKKMTLLAQTLLTLELALIWPPRGCPNFLVMFSSLPCRLYRVNKRKELTHRYLSSGNCFFEKC